MPVQWGEGRVPVQRVEGRVPVQWVEGRAPARQVRGVQWFGGQGARSSLWVSLRVSSCRVAHYVPEPSWVCCNAGSVEDPQLTAFACALRDAKPKDLGHGMQLISFGPGPFFPDDDDLHRSDLVARDFYDPLFERISVMRKSLLTGIPGTGKSWWIW